MSERSHGVRHARCRRTTNSCGRWRLGHPRAGNHLAQSDTVGFRAFFAKYFVVVPKLFGQCLPVSYRSDGREFRIAVRAISCADESEK